tara:strand:+ start:212 stop:496 length:285 start_codon:yes stop_codon:yes gene_type:complete
MKKVYPNRIRELNKWKATDELTMVSAEDGMYAADNWRLPQSHLCIVRAELPDGKVRERAYRLQKAANMYMLKLIANGANFHLMTHDHIKSTHFL